MNTNDLDKQIKRLQGQNQQMQSLLKRFVQTCERTNNKTHNPQALAFDLNPIYLQARELLLQMNGPSQNKKAQEPPTIRRT